MRLYFKIGIERDGFFVPIVENLIEQYDKKNKVVKAEFQLPNKKLPPDVAIYMFLDQELIKRIECEDLSKEMDAEAYVTINISLDFGN